MSLCQTSFYANVGKPLNKKDAGIAIKKVIEDGGEPSNWFRDLDKQRNFFIHEGAP